MTKNFLVQTCINFTCNNVMPLQLVEDSGAKLLHVHSKEAHVNSVISSNVQMAFARYGKLSAISGLAPSGPAVQNFAFIPGQTSTTFSNVT